MTKAIVTIFAGRRNNLAILGKYLRKALDCQIISEVHFWNYAREIEDELYLKSISNLKRTSQSIHSDYIEVHTEVINNAFEFTFKASHDMHIKLKQDYVASSNLSQGHEVAPPGSMK